MSPDEISDAVARRERKMRNGLAVGDRVVVAIADPDGGPADLPVGTTGEVVELYGSHTRVAVFRPDEGPVGRISLWPGRLAKLPPPPEDAPHG